MAYKLRLGYSHLIEQLALPSMPLPAICVLNTALAGRQSRDLGGNLIEEFGASYKPEDSVIGHLRFALRYEGVNLQVLKLTFDRVGSDPVQEALRARPASVPVRRLAYLFEWLTSQNLQLPRDGIPGKPRYASVLDEQLQFGLPIQASTRHEKYKIIDNLPGTPAFCPLVRKIPYLTGMVAKNLKGRAAEKLSAYDRKLLLRAAAYLYLKETHSSFEVENIKPSTNRAQRFADLLHEAESGNPLSMDRFVELQNAVVDQRMQEASWRQIQNWLGTDYGYRKKVEFVPARPPDVASLIDGLIAMDGRLSHARQTHPDTELDAVVAATLVSFGFVFIHPFVDGNGRLHRYLIHEQLSASGFTPKGIILPVSAVILANIERYRQALEAFSKPVMLRTSYNPDVPETPATGNDALYFQYFDATEQASFLYDALERTIEKDLDEEISFLLGFDRALEALNSVGDWRGHELELFIRVVHQNDCRLSATKRKSQFPLLSDQEVARFETIVERAFDPSIDKDDILRSPKEM